MKHLWKTSLVSVLLLLVACGEDTFEPEDPSVPQACSVGSSKNATLSAVFDCDGNKLRDVEASSEKVSWIKPSYLEPSHRWLGGVAKLPGCTGSLIEPEGATEDSPAYIITNGHCVQVNGSYPPSEGHVLNQPYVAQVQFFQFFDIPFNALRPTFTSKILNYASMDGTDVALLQLEDFATLGLLKQAGITAYKLSKTKPKVGQKIETAGMPAIHVDEVVLRQSVCHVEEEVHLLEGPFEFEEAYQMKCNVLSGSSGSSVFDFETKEIVGLVNTTVNDNSEGLESCAINRPCEVGTNDSKTVDTEANYMQPIAFLVDCFTDKGVFDTSLDNCKLK